MPRRRSRRLGCRRSGAGELEVPVGMVPVGELPLSVHAGLVCLLASKSAPRACWPRVDGGGGFSRGVADRRCEISLVFGVLRLPPGEDIQVAWSASGGDEKQEERPATNKRGGATACAERAS